MSESKDRSTRTISVVMVITLLGKVLGLFRDHLMAVHYGTTGMEAKAFYIASRIPRVFFDVVFASAIAACFIPVFSEYLYPKWEKRGLPLRKQLPLSDGPAHRGPHGAGHPVRPAPGDPVRGRL